MKINVPYVFGTLSGIVIKAEENTGKYIPV